MLPLRSPASLVAASIDDASIDDATIDARFDGARPTTIDPTPLARQLATTRDALLRSMARDHLALCPEVKAFPDRPGTHQYEAHCFKRLVAYANERLASPSAEPPVAATAWERKLDAPMEAERFVSRVAPRLTEAAVCRALARQLRRGADAHSDAHGDAHGDVVLSARSLWREARATAGAPQAAIVIAPLPGSPSQQLRIEGDEWASITGPARMERSVRVGDLALIDQAEGVRSRLSAHARERVALTAIDASSSADLRAFPAAWVCTSGVAAALLERLDDHEMSQWMARQALTEQPEIARRIAASGVDAWRHGLVAVSADRLGRTVVLESLNARASGHADNRSLTAARSLGDAGRVRDLVGGVLGGIGKGLTADEAVSILRREDDVEPSRPVLRGEEDEWPSPAHRHGHRYNAAFLDALAPALRDGRLSAVQATELLDSGTPSRPIVTGSTADIAHWFGAIFKLWRDERISAGQARSLMLGLDRCGSSVWHAALRHPVDTSNVSTALSLVRAWDSAIRAGLLPCEALRDGLLSRAPDGERSELARASAARHSHCLSAVFRELGRLQRRGVLPEADLRLILDTTLDTGGMAEDVAEEPLVDLIPHPALIRSIAQRQLATFERLMNQCLRARIIDGASAARFLLARPDGQTSRSVRAAGCAGGNTDIHRRMLDDAVHRGDLSPAQRTEALQAAGRHALAIYPRHDSPPAAAGA